MPAEPDTTVTIAAHQDPGRLWVAAAALLTAATSLALAFLPTFTTSAELGGTERQSLVEHEGWGTAAILLIPVLLSVLPWVVPARHKRWVTTAAAMLVAGGALVSVASVGLFYLPSAALLVVAAVRTSRLPVLDHTAEGELGLNPSGP